MKPRLRVIRDQVENLIDYFVENNLAIDVNSISTLESGTSKRLIWRLSKGLAVPASKLSFGSWAEYSNFVLARNFSLMLPDGSFILYSFDFQSDVLSGHSLLFYPAPAIFHPDDLDEFELLDLVEYCCGDIEKIRLRSPLRFDYDPANQKPDHSAVHLHFNSAACRLPVHQPLSPSVFTSFLLKHFYPEIWEQHAYFQQPLSLALSTTLTAEEFNSSYLQMK